MGRCWSSSYHLKQLVPVAHQVSPRIKNGVPSASCSACWFGVARRKPRRRGFCCFCSSVQATASKEPLLPARPSSGGYDPLCHFQKRVYRFWDGARTFKVRLVATEPGLWKWQSGSCPPEEGLAGKSGSFEAVAWTEEQKQQNPLRRGFLRATPY